MGDRYPTVRLESVTLDAMPSPRRGRAAATLIITTALLLAGCGTDPTDRPTRAVAAPPVPAPTSTPAQRHAPRDPPDPTTTTTEPTTTTTSILPRTPPPQPTTTTTTPPHAPQRPPAASGSVEAAIHSAFDRGGLYSAAWRVSDCESSHEAGIVSPNGQNFGLFQIAAVHRRQFEQVEGVPWSSVLSAGPNAAFARWLYDESGGWSAWSCAWSA